MLRLTTFGGLGLTHDGRPVDGTVAQRRRLLVLAILASEHPAAMSRQRLATLLWGAASDGDDSDAARNNLRQAIFALRRGFAVLGEPAEPVLGASELTLDPRVLVADCIAFTDAMRSGDLSAAIQHHRGSFLAGVTLDDNPQFTEWVELRRARYASQFRSACAAAAADASARGAWDEALGAWTALRTDAPADRDAIRGVLQALVSTGRMADAQREATRYDALFRSDPIAGSGPSTCGAAAAMLEALAASSDSLRTSGIIAATPASAADAPSPRSPAGQIATTERVPAGLRRRRTWIPFAIAAALLVSAGGWRWRTGRLAASTPLPASHARTGIIVVEPVVAQRGDTTLHGRIAELQDRMSARLSALGWLPVLPEVAAPAGAEFVWHGTASPAGPDSVAVTLTLEHRTAQGVQQVALAPVMIPRAGVSVMSDTLAERATATMAFLRDTVIYPAPPVTTPPPTVAAYEEFVQSHAAYITQGDIAGALRHARTALGASASFPLAGLYGMHVLRIAGECRSALALGAQIRPHVSKPFEVAWLDANAAGAKGQWQLFLEAALRAQQAAPHSQAVLSYVLQGLERVNALHAADSVVRANHLEPTRDLLVPLHVIYHYLGFYDRDVAAMEYLLATDRSNHWIAVALAQALSATAPDSAVRVATTLVPQAGDYADVPAGEQMREVGVELIIHGHPQQAAQVFAAANRWFDQRPPAERARPLFRLYFARLLVTAGDNRRAREVIATVRDADLNSVRRIELHGTLGIIAARLRDHQGVTAADRWLASQPDKCVLGQDVLWRARIGAADGRPADAVGLISDALNAGYPAALTPGDAEDIEQAYEFVPLMSRPDYLAVMRPH